LFAQFNFKLPFNSSKSSMCGIAALLGTHTDPSTLREVVQVLDHRGPDASRIYVSPSGTAALAHNRLSILDLTADGNQPMSDPSGRYHLIFNGEIYNYRELREQLASHWTFRTRTDTEVLLASLILNGESAISQFLGMFSFVFWDEREQTAFAARDRFGVKPFYFHATPDGELYVASEIKALHALGVPRESDDATWATYLVHGLYDHGRSTFWKGVESLGPGECLRWKNHRVDIRPWYDLVAAVGDEIDNRPDHVVCEEYLELLLDSVALRFRSDVPIGINLSSGLDSSLLLGLVRKYESDISAITAFTFTTGDPNYDELAYVSQSISGAKQPLVECRLRADEVPALTNSVSKYQDEPFGGLPTIAYAKLFETARQHGVIVLLDGQGMDEQWAGYDYYRNTEANAEARTVQGTVQSPVRPLCIREPFRRLGIHPTFPAPFSDQVRNLQYRDIRYTKFPRALRFNDRISMRASTELREPFLDHRLVELALRQPVERKIRGKVQKDFLRQLAKTWLPVSLTDVPKRPLQTPQREWLRGPLKNWAEEMIHVACASRGDWLDQAAVQREWRLFREGHSDNSFYVWQWISVGVACLQDESYAVTHECRPMTELQYRAA
jgi:asparagine synthase (glutamine-hydrolysing)